MTEEIIEREEEKKNIHPEQLTNDDMIIIFRRAQNLGCAKYIPAINALYSEYHNGAFTSHQEATAFLQKELQQSGLVRRYSLYDEPTLDNQSIHDTLQEEIKTLFEEFEHAYVFVKTGNEMSPPIREVTPILDNTLFGSTALAYVYIQKEANIDNDNGPKTFKEFVAEMRKKLTFRKSGSYATFNERKIGKMLDTDKE